MKPALHFILFIISVSCTAQILNGAWKLKTTDGNEVIKIYGDKYFMAGAYSAEGKFVFAYGGVYSLTGNAYTETYYFFTSDSTLVGQSRSFRIRLKNKTIELNYNDTREEWAEIDNGSTVLTGTWRFGARVDDNGVAGERRNADSPRQTIKILSGKYFQWAAFNRETKQFFGSGGGTYTLSDGRYIEHIQFFSRDNSRSGMSLSFDCRLDGNDWYHKGKGTAGNPVSEVWERIKP